MAIVLASRSPRRQELLKKAGLAEYTVLVPDTEETCPDGLSPEETVVHIAREKALAVRPLVSPDDLVIAADTMVFLDGKAMGKPAGKADALAMLTALQGRAHFVSTGVAVLHGDRLTAEAETTKVFFREASEEELRRYVATGEPMDKAGAYGIQGLGSLFVEKIDGDFYNVMGLPIERLGRVLTRFGVKFF